MKKMSDQELIRFLIEKSAREHQPDWRVINMLGWFMLFIGLLIGHYIWK